jgi:hypothetical protein
MQLFSADAAIFFDKISKMFAHEKMKKLLSKVAHNQPKFFFQYCGPKPAQISISVP